MTTRKRPTTGEVQMILSTNDIARLQAFYEELFGAEEYTRVPGRRGPFFVGLRFGAGDLVLVANERGAAVKPGRAVLAVFVGSVDDVLSRVESAGGRVSGRAKDMPWGHRVAHITDPDGNPVNLTQRITARSRAKTRSGDRTSRTARSTSSG